MKAGIERDILQQDRDAGIGQEQLFAEQVRHLCRQSRVTALGAVVCSAIVAVTLRNVVPPWRLALWFTYCAIIHSVRQAISAACEKSSHTSDAVIKWNNHFHITAAISTVLWGLTVVFLFPVGSPEHQFILLACVAGISCAAAMVYSGSSTGCELPITWDIIGLSSGT